MDRPPLPNSSPKFAPQEEEEEDDVSSMRSSPLAPKFADQMDDAPVAPLSSGENKNWHQRKISWGVDTLLGPTAIDSLGPLPADISPLPSLRARSSSLTSPAEVPRPRSGSVNSTSIDDTNDRQAAYIHNLFAGAPPHRRQGLHRSKISSLGGVDLNDIIKESPMEQEAETYILKAIEQRAAESVQEEAPAAFASVPDEAISAMSTQEETTTPAAGTVEPLESSSALSPAPTTASSSRTPLPQHATTNATYHRRKQTMEQQLYGLAAAIDAIQTEAQDSQEELPSYHPEDDLPVTTSATTLEQNASLLYSPKSPNRRHLLGGFRGSSRRHLVVDKEPSTEPPAEDHNNKDSLSLSQSLNPETTGSADTTYSHTPLKDIEEGGEESDDNNNDPGMDATGSTQPTSNKSKKKKKKKKNLSNLRDIEDFFAPKKTTVALYLRVMFLYIATPLLGIAAILFYLADNPPTGRSNTTTTDQASIAWWLVFAVRQIVTFSLAKLTEMLFIDYLTIRSRGTMKVLGPWATLFILQSKGWPSTISLWSIFNFCLLSGDYDFPRHWLYWQGIVKLFGPENPAGNIVSSSWNYRILGIALALGIVVSVKRVLLGLYLGKRTFEAYADQLAKIMKDILMISEVAALAKDFEREHRIKASRKNAGGSPVQRGDSIKAQRASLIDILNDDTDLDGASASGGGPSLASMADKSSPTNVGYVIDPDDRNPWSGLLSFTQQQRIIQLLGAWEEPVIAEKPVDENISVSALLQFRRSMACLNTPTPFGGSFGLADKREHCIKSSQDVYRRLLLNNNEEETDLHFETLALLGLTRDGTLDQSKLKELIRLFRPDRDGTLSILHFVKSIDKVYKDIRLLRASVTNTSKIDRSFETIVNWIFYIIAGTIILSILGYSPMALFLSISGVILAFAFMIGSASSKYFEGLLFILVRRPYAIGDGIHVMGVESEGIFTGHPFWYVEDVSLFTTSVMYMYTGERATLSNGSLANSRIVNATRSPQAWMYTLLKFPVDVSLEKLQIFNTALEQFFRNRPREWRSYDSFRATRLDAQAGFIEYMVICTHRNSWHDWATVHVSKADMIHFCLELSKQLGIFYRTPPMPIDLTVRNSQPMSFATNPGEFLGPAPVPATDPMTMSAPPQHPDLEDLQSRFPPRLR